jgi:hypothetical protein
MASTLSDVNRLKDFCALGLAVGRAPQDVAEQYGVAYEQVEKWLTQDELFIAQVREYREQVVASGQSTAYARVASDAPTNVDRLIAIRDNPRVSPPAQVAAAKELSRLLAAGMREGTPPPVPDLDKETVQGFVEALALALGKNSEEVAAEHNLSARPIPSELED